MKERNLEIKVGSFVLLGLIAIGILVVAFGRFGDLFAHSYEITVPFPNASGIIKNSQVLYRGAKVGSVVSPPQIIREGEAVELVLKIRADVKIPEGAKFRIGSYGLLGDRFVDVIPPEKSSGQYMKNGEKLDTMQDQAKSLGDIAEQMQPIVQRLDRISEKIDNKIMNEKTTREITEAVTSTKDLLARADRFMGEAEAGKGTIYMLLKDQKTAADLRETISDFKKLSYNLRVHGLLFYSDESKQKDADKEKPDAAVKR